MNTRIFVKDGYYNINKITDYNPLGDGLTNVELVKIVDGDAFISERTVITNKLTKWEYLNTSFTYRRGGSTVPLDPVKNTTDSSYALVVGKDTRIGSNSDYSIISGTDNIIGPDSPSSTILGGSGNTIDSSAGTSLIFGSNNSFIGAGAGGSLIIGADNVTITEPNTFVIGDLVIKDGIIQTSADIIDGGDNETRSLFSNFPYELIEGGDDEVRTQFPQNPQNVIDGNGDTL